MGPISDDVRFRKATEADLERIDEIHRVAYVDFRAHEARQRCFTRHPLGDLDRLVLAECDRTIVAQAFLFKTKAHFGGVSVKVGAIASVAVAPEARGRGIATALLGELHRRSSARGDALTMLYAFRHGFYARLGYAAGSSRKRLAIDLRSIPASWCKLAKTRVRALRPRDPIAKIHEAAAAQASGWIARQRRYWERLVTNERRTTLITDDLRGYCVFSFDQAESHAETTVEVAELVALDPTARRALFGALAGLRDQASELVVELPIDDPIEQALDDPDGRRYGREMVEHDLGAIVGGPMVRVTDVARAIEARGYAVDGNFDLELTDEGLAATIRIARGRAKLTPAARPNGKRVFRTTRRGLSAILYGGLLPSAAVSLGLAEGRAPADDLLRIPPLSPIDPF